MIFGQSGAWQGVRRRELYVEALEIYLPLAAQYPAAFADKLLMVLQNYTEVAEENDDDPWWQLWRQLQAEGGPEGGREAE